MGGRKRITQYTLFPCKSKHKVGKILKGDGRISKWLSERSISFNLKSHIHTNLPSKKKKKKYVPFMYAYIFKFLFIRSRYSRPSNEHHRKRARKHTHTTNHIINDLNVWQYGFYYSENSKCVE